MSRESKQAQTLLRVFEALGPSLIGAIDELMAWQSPGTAAPPEESAKRFAALLSASIGTGTQMAGRLASRSQEEAESVRLRTATLAGAVIAQHYVLSGGALPDDAFNKRLSAAFDSLLSLADSFPLLPEEQENQTDMVAARVEALTPFVQAVMRFSFGADDSRVIHALGERLCDKASALADAFSNGHNGGPDVYALRELAFLKGSAKLLARACEVEMDRLQHAMAQGQASEPPAPEMLQERIWQRFEDGVDVLRAVIGFISDPVTETSPQRQQPAPQQMQQTAASAKPQGIPGNPMSFFVKKDDEAKSGEAA